MLYVEGRKVKIVTGTQSQTVRVMTEQNIDGRFDYVLRLAPPVRELEVELIGRGFDSIQELVAYLKHEHRAQVEQAPAVKSHQNPPWQSASLAVESPVAVRAPTTAAPDIPARPLSAWEQEAVRLVEETIDELVRGFIRNPYLHRVEHSLHCELYLMLKQHKLFSDLYPLGRGMTQCLHKEWPEWRTRPEKGNRRGEYDLAVISPDDLSAASLDDFLQGRIEPLLAIEFGLDYRYDHLRDDDAKLTNSGLRKGYLVHLTREALVDDYAAVERLVLASRHRTAYAHIGYRQTAFKLLGDTTIQFAEMTR